MTRLLSLSRYSAPLFALLIAGSTPLLADVPRAPRNVDIDIEHPQDAAGTYTGILSWQGSNDADGYRVYVKTLGEDMTVTGYDLLMETPATSVTLEDRIDIVSGAFAFYVTAFNNDGESAPGNAVSSACGRVWEDGDLSEYTGSGLTAIVSTPGAFAQERTAYRYDVNSFAEYTGNPSLSLEYGVDGPEGMSIDPRSGVITWIPQAAGTYAVMVTSRVQGEYDQQMWQLEVAPEAVTSVDDSETPVAVRAYPNPATSHLTVHFTATAGRASLVLVDAQGTEVRKQALTTIDGANTVSLHVKDLAAGTYYLRMTTNSGTTTTPLTIVR